MRGYLAGKSLKQLRQTKLMHDSAILLQKHLRCMLAIKLANFKRLKIGAAIMIQATWRSVYARRYYRKTKARHERSEQF